LAAGKPSQEGHEIVVVVGPTASGKSSLALAWAEAHDGEIVGADSVHVYRHFDIGSSKPSLADRARVRHHLIDVAEPHEPMDAASYAARASAAIADIHSRGKLPIVCGGTFLWVRALLYGLSQAPRGDAALRAHHAAWAAREGRAALHARLNQVDPVSAAKLNPNDLVRVSRALEVFELTGQAMSAWQAAHGFSKPHYRAHLLGVRWTPEELLARITARTRVALEQGWIEEVIHLLDAGYRETRAMASVGYRQVVAHLDGELNRDELVVAIDRATKIFARRQRTWLREEDVQWLDGHALELS
jgi:tRNA dimethylallyltransferase